MYYVLYLLTLSLITLVVNCDYKVKGTMNCSAQLKDFDSRVISVEKPTWNVERVDGSSAYKQDKLFFLDQDIGFSVENGNWNSKFRNTIDRGRTWKESGAFEDFATNSIFFLSSSDGFAVGYRLKPSSIPSDNGSDILKTSDGGKSWNSALFVPNSTLRKIIFSKDGRTGAVVGRKSSPSQWDAASIIIISTNKGSDWQDISENLSKVSVESNNYIPSSLVDALFDKDGNLLVLTDTGKVYKYDNGPKVWEFVVKIQNDRNSHTGFSKFGFFENNNLWLAGGAGSSVEGALGTIAVCDGTSWNKYSLDGFFFMDTKFLSDTEIIVAGSDFATLANSNSRNSGQGVVLFSNDQGKTWEKVHETPSVKTFTSILQISRNELHIFDDKGGFIVLNR